MGGCTFRLFLGLCHLVKYVIKVNVNMSEPMLLFRKDTGLLHSGETFVTKGVLNE